VTEAKQLPVVHTGGLRGSNPLDEFLAGQLSARTRKAYASDLRYFFGAEQITPEMARAVTFQDVAEFRNHLAELGYKRTTINRKLASLKAFYKMLVAAGVVDRNPADSSLVRGYRIDDSLVGKAIPAKAMSDILAAIGAVEDPLVRTRDTALFHLLTYGGLRRSEVAAMRWEDISQEGVYSVLTMPQTKSGVTQTVKLQPAVIHYLEQYRGEQLAAGHSAQGPVFISLSRNQSHGSGLTDQSVNLIVKKYALRAGVPRNITAHMFRHTCCTLAIEGGARPQQVQAHLRHKDLKTTMRYYEDRERLRDNASDYIELG
jgi:site-specific recombinase XerD